MNLGGEHDRFDKVFGLPIPSVNALAPTTVSNGTAVFLSDVAFLAFP